MLPDLTCRDENCRTADHLHGDGCWSTCSACTKARDVRNREFLTGIGLTEEWGVRIPTAVDDVDHWYHSKAWAQHAQSCYDDGAVLIHRWVTEPTVHRG
jgi:hypothetical protein